MTIGLAQFFTVKNADGTVLHKWQNFWVNQTVDTHAFLPFQAEAIFSKSSASSDTLSITMPISASLLPIIDAGLMQFYIGTIDLYQFQPSLDGLPPATKLLATSFTGEFVSAEVLDTTINLAIGSNIDSTESQVPIRKFTSTLAGIPPKL